MDFPTYALIGAGFWVLLSGLLTLLQLASFMHKRWKMAWAESGGSYEDGMMDSGALRFIQRTGIAALFEFFDLGSKVTDLIGGVVILLLMSTLMAMLWPLTLLLVVVLGIPVSLTVAVCTLVRMFFYSRSRGDG